jgi:hypothetical protein
MKKLLTLALLVTNSLFGQLTYVDNFDGVYPYPTAQVLVDYNFDINSDGQNDIRFSSNGASASYKKGYFSAILNSFGQNKINLISNGGITLDCTNDTLNPLDSWQNGDGYVYYWQVATNSFMVNGTMGFGPHKQGFRLLLTNPANGSLGYKYGYINYTLTNGGDVIIHDWYYENTFNVPIVANSQLQYPYDGNCIHYDTVTVQDTIVTQVFDTITTQIFDTVLVSVTDTLIINTALNLPAPNNCNVIKVYPNPASDHVTIDNGNYTMMSGYTIKIENSAGQQVFTSLVNQAQFYIDISNWTGNGMYYIHLIDPQNNTVTIRKIVVQ